MALYCYIKTTTKLALNEAGEEKKGMTEKGLEEAGRTKKKEGFFGGKFRGEYSTLVSVLLIVVGISFLLFAGVPIFSWGVNYDKKAPEDKLVKPVADSLVGGEVLAEERDLTKASNWFVGAKVERGETDVKEYKMSIPKLGIEDAKVIVGGDDLEKGLIHYGRTAIPGSLGTAVVFGHSVLPQFFNPKNYHAIFATLPEIEVGDEVYVEVDDVTYKYVVYDMETVEPTDLSVLEQHFDNYYLSIITCVPPGLDLKRLVVKLKLEVI